MSALSADLLTGLTGLTGTFALAHWSPAGGASSPAGMMSTTWLSALTLMRGRISAIQGLIHLVLFFAWIATILDEASPIPTTAP